MWWCYSVFWGGVLGMMLRVNSQCCYTGGGVLDVMLHSA